jgi:hypothetical protein
MNRNDRAALDDIERAETVRELMRDANGEPLRAALARFDEDARVQSAAVDPLSTLR